MSTPETQRHQSELPETPPSASCFLVRRPRNAALPLTHSPAAEGHSARCTHHPAGRQACLQAAPGWTASPGRCQVGRPATPGRWLGVAVPPLAAPWRLAACPRTVDPAGGRRPGCWRASVAGGCPSGWTPLCGGQCAAPAAQAQCLGRIIPSYQPIIFRYHIQKGVLFCAKQAYQTSAWQSREATISARAFCKARLVGDITFPACRCTGSTVAAKQTNRPTHLTWQMVISTQQISLSKQHSHLKVSHCTSASVQF